jgi:hypothetical protein
MDRETYGKIVINLFIGLIIFIINFLFFHPQIQERIEMNDYDAAAANICIIGGSFIIASALFFNLKKLIYYIILVAGIIFSNTFFIKVFIEKNWDSNIIKEMKGMMIFINMIFLLLICTKQSIR